MKLTLEQTKLVGLTMELDLKARDYKALCAELEALKKKKLDPNDPKYADLLKRFILNQNEIKEITKKLNELR